MSKSYKEFSHEEEQLDEILGIGTAAKLAGKGLGWVWNNAKKAWEGGKQELGVSKGSDEKGFSKAS